MCGERASGFAVRATARNFASYLSSSLFLGILPTPRDGSSSVTCRDATRVFVPDDDKTSYQS